MKRYWLFAWETYYPLGGMQDFRMACDTIEECLECHEKLDKINYEIFDSENKVIVSSNDLFNKWEVHKNKNIKNTDYDYLEDIYPETLWD